MTSPQNTSTDIHTVPVLAAEGPQQPLAHSGDSSLLAQLPAALTGGGPFPHMGE